MRIAQLMTGGSTRAHRLPALLLPDLAALFEPQAEASLGSVSESNRPAITSLSEHSQLSQKALHVGSIGFPAAASNHTPLPTYPKTRVWGFGLPDETRIETERSVSVGATWACGSGSGRKASGSGEFRIFDPAGIALSTSAYGWTRLFQGREYIPMLDAYDFRARTLWPELGRFGQEDPLGTVSSMNRYQALGNSWMNSTDPLGLFDSGLTSFEQAENRRAREAEARVSRELCARNNMSLHCSGDLGRMSVVAFGDKKAELIHGVGARRFPNGRRAIFVNGIQNSRSEALSSGIAVSQHYSVSLDVLWNPEVNVAIDLAQVAFVNKANLPDATTILLVEELRSRTRSLRSGQTITVFAHSQGAAITSSALSFLTENERRQVDVVALGGAAWTFPDGVHSVVRISNVFDPVPMLTGGGLWNGAGLWGEASRTDTLVFGYPIHPLSGYFSDLDGASGRERDRQREALRVQEGRKGR